MHSNGRCQTEEAQSSRATAPSVSTILRRLERGKEPDIGSAGYLHLALPSIARRMRAMFFFQEREHSSGSGEASCRAHPELAINCDCSNGGTRPQLARSAIQLFLRAHLPAWALWEDRVWGFPAIRDTLKRTRCLSVSSSVSTPMNHCRIAPSLILLPEPPFMVTSRPSTHTAIHRACRKQLWRAGLPAWPGTGMTRSAALIPGPCIRS